MKGYPLFFKIDNDWDACSFCKAKGKLLKALNTGKCICPQCVAFISGEMQNEPLALPMHQAVKPLEIDPSSPF